MYRDVYKRQEAESLTQAARYERSEARQGYRSGHYDRNLTTTSGEDVYKRQVQELEERGLIVTERTSIITQDGRKQNGSLLYTCLLYTSGLKESDACTEWARNILL